MGDRTMKKALSLILIAGIITASLTGCATGNDDNGRYKGLETTAKVAETTTVTTEETTEETTVTTTEKETPDETIPAPMGSSGSGFSSALTTSDGMFATDKLFAAFDDGDRETGYVASDASDVDSALASMEGCSVKPLASDTIASDMENNPDEPVFYKFAMYNSENASLIEDEGIYASTLTLNGSEYLVTFGSDYATTYAEAAYYSTAGSTLEYWAFAIESDDGGYILIPVIAGGDIYDYYTVRPNLSMLGFDVSDMTIYEDDNAAAETTTKKPTASIGSVDPSDFELDLSLVSNSGDTMEFEYTLINDTDYPIWLDAESVLLNGEDISDDFSAYFEAPANGVGTGTVYLFDRKIKSGDELIYSATVIDTDSYDEIAQIHFPLTFTK